MLFFLASTIQAVPPHPKYFLQQLDNAFKPLKNATGMNISNVSQSGDPDVSKGGYKPQPDGVEYILAVRIDFSDQPGRKPASDFNNAIFGTRGSSMRLYFEEVSYGRMQISPGYLGGVVPGGNRWYRAKEDMSYYGKGFIPFEEYRQLVEEACAAADADVDFSKYDRDNDGYVDHFMLIHAGNDEASTAVNNDIWSVVIGDIQGIYDGVGILTAMIVAEDPRSNFINVGIYCHEFFHEFGAPDLYAWDQPVGHWCLMGEFGPYQDDGKHPSHICGYLKWDFDADPSNGVEGWLKPVTLKNSGAYYVDSFERPKGDRLYKIDIPSRLGKEYFLIENRNKSSGAIYDTYLPESGIVIWHIDEKRPAFYGNPHRVWVEDPSDPGHDGFTEATQGAAYSANDGQTAFTPDTNPDSSANDGAYSGIIITDIGPEGTSMSFNLFYRDTYEPNDSMNDAFGPLVYGREYRSFIQSEQDVDYYRFAVDKSGSILTYLENIPEDCNYDLYIYDPNQKLVAKSTKPENSVEVISFNTRISGTYYLKVSSMSGFSLRKRYSLTVESVSPTSSLIAAHGVYPNPGPGMEGVIRFNYKLLSQVDNVTLDIYTTTGALIYSQSKPFAKINDELFWNGRTISGERTAIGIYFYVLKAYLNGEIDIKTGKVAIIY